MKNVNLTDFLIFKDVENGLKEYCVSTESGPKFLDFFIKELNLCIEFDSEYWHRNRKEADELRDIHIKNVLKNLQILHIKELDYINNKFGIINDLIILIERKIKEYYNK